MHVEGAQLSGVTQLQADTYPGVLWSFAGLGQGPGFDLYMVEAKLPAIP